MKLIRKQCPNCGAGLKFNSNDKEVTCEYCKQSFIIEGNEQDDNLELVSEVREAILDNVVSGFKTAKTMSTVGFVIFFIIFFLVFAFIIFTFVTMMIF